MFSHYHRLAMLTTAVALVAAATLTLRAAPSPKARSSTEIKRELEGAHFDPSSVQVNRRPPIPFEPLEMRDPSSGKPISPDTVLTLRNGKKVKAGEYYAQLNQMERHLNELGYSLRGNQPQKIVLQEPRGLQEKLAKQKSTMEASRRAPTLREKELMRVHLDSRPPGTRIPEPMLWKRDQPPDPPSPPPGKDPGQPNLQPQPVQLVNPFDWSGGDTSTFAAYFHSDLEAAGSADAVSVVGTISAGGNLFGTQVNILDALGSLYAPRNAARQVYVNINVADHTILNFNQTVTNPLSRIDFASQPFDFSTKAFDISAAGFGVSLKIGIKGNADVAYSAAVDSSDVALDLQGRFHSSVYAQASAHLFFIDVGVGVNMTFMDVDAHETGRLAVGFDSYKGPYVDVAAEGDLDLEALKGKFYLAVNPFGLHEFDITLWDWTGFSVKGYLFLVQKRVYLDPNFVPKVYHINPVRKEPIFIPKINSIKPVPKEPKSR